MVKDQAPSTFFLAPFHKGKDRNKYGQGQLLQGNCKLYQTEPDTKIDPKRQKFRNTEDKSRNVEKLETMRGGDDYCRAIVNYLKHKR